MGNIFLSESRDYLCPVCHDGVLLFRDYCDRIVRYEGGDSEWIRIPRCQCNNKRCGRIHRMLPDFLAPFKHYPEPVISDVLDGGIDPADVDDCPSAQSAKRWGQWLMKNKRNIDGYLKSVAHRELDFSEELLKSGVSLLGKLRSSIPGGWLRTILRIIYNSGGFLEPFYP